MTPTAYTEDTLVQQTTGRFFTNRQSERKTEIYGSDYYAQRPADNSVARRVEAFS